MIIPEWIAIFIVCAALVIVVGLLLTVALVILTEAIEFYFKRLKRQYEVADVCDFVKDYKEWKTLKETHEPK